MIGFDGEEHKPTSPQTSKRMPCGATEHRVTPHSSGLWSHCFGADRLHGAPREPGSLCCPWWCFPTLHPAHSRLRSILDTSRLT